MDIGEISRSFWRGGFVVLEDFFDPELMGACTASVLDHYGLAPALVHNEEFLRISQTEVIPWIPLGGKRASLHST